MILILFGSKFIGVFANNYFSIKRLDKVIAKNETVQFFLTHSVHSYGSISNILKYFIDVVFSYPTRTFFSVYVSI